MDVKGGIPLKVTVQPLKEADLDAADQVFRVAFGTFLGVKEPGQLWESTDFVHTRWRSNPGWAFGARSGSELVGSNFAACWGSLGFFGPLTVRPDFWDRGIGKRLMEPVVELFSQWGVRHAGLFTFPQSPKHVSLYQKFGFWPRSLTAIMSKPVQSGNGAAASGRFSDLAERERESCLVGCNELTSAIYDGLTVESEIQAVDGQGLGETIMIVGPTRVEALAVCHCGAGTEAGSGACYVKFGAVRPQPKAMDVFDQLLEACEALAAERGLSRLVAGVNTARHEAYRRMIERGFRTEIQGLAMQKPNEAAYNRPGVYLIDDWR
jgi:GNAT superfamily N-acetyltransferase